MGNKFPINRFFEKSFPILAGNGKIVSHFFCLTQSGKAIRNQNILYILLRFFLEESQFKVISIMLGTCWHADCIIAC